MVGVVVLVLAPFESPLLGVGSKGADIAVDRGVGPVLLEDELREWVVIAEGVLDVSPDTICCESEASDAREEVDVSKRRAWSLCTIVGSQWVHWALCARSWANAMRFLPHPTHW